MSKPSSQPLSPTRPQALSRRSFVAGSGAALSFTFLQPRLNGAAEAGRKINLGLIGCGGRGRWIADLFAKHGGYNLVGVFDYFGDKANAAGDQFKLPAANRYTGLNGYKKLLEQTGLDAVAIESPPFFHPQQAADAVAAGKHVYLAKPIAVDVPGCVSVEESGKAATARKLAFQVDFQTRAHPAFQEVLKRTHAGEIGRLVTMDVGYHCDLYFEGMDAEYRKSKQDAEARVRAWAIDRVLSGDVITEQNIHSLDVATWFANAAPLKAVGTGGRARDFLGDCWDHYAVIFSFPDNLIASFSAKQVGFGYDDIMCRAYGMSGTVDTHYSGKVTLRTKDDAFSGDCRSMYQEGAVRNIATFHDRISQGDFSNPTVGPSVRSNLTTILGRTAAYTGKEITWAEMMKKAEKWDFPLDKLKA
ncbi:MAG: Gfo/Idh/MocA family protein [Limisphaerales bacterium]